MARVIRLQTNKQMVHKIITYLNDTQLRPVPSESTIFKMLSYMPSGNLKAMQVSAL